MTCESVGVLGFEVTLGAFEFDIEHLFDFTFQPAIEVPFVSKVNPPLFALSD